MNQYLNYKEFNDSSFKAKIPKSLKSLFFALRRGGGKPYLVGGAVIDLLCEVTPKDWDIEVFDVSIEKLSMLLSEFGKVDLIGKKFGIVKLKYSNLDLEFSIPRTENKTGIRHKDFDINLEPSISVKNAALRRDFTVNAIYYDYFESKIVDPYKGLWDLKRGLLRHVSYATFKEDPLRVFRGIQIIARKLHESTEVHDSLVRSMVDKEKLKEVQGESIFQEMNKMFSKATSFSAAANHLENTNLLKFFGLDELPHCQQNPKHHPEGNVWIHTRLVVENAFKYRDELPEDWRLPFMWGMLLHDIGKPAMTDPETLSAYGHAERGAKLAETYMARFTDSKSFVSKVVAIVRLHMRARELVRHKAKRPAWIRLQHQCRLDVLAYVSMCDSDGRGFPPEGKEGDFSIVMDKWEEIGAPCDKVPPVLMGRHLIEQGLKPNDKFGAYLEKAYSYQIKHNETDVEKLLHVAIGKRKVVNRIRI
jgi:tRNA nucleotidyltransferase (CCA-adding enzyme)